MGKMGGPLYKVQGHLFLLLGFLLMLMNRISANQVISFAGEAEIAIVSNEEVVEIQKTPDCV